MSVIVLMLSAVSAAAGIWWWRRRRRRIPCHRHGANEDRQSRQQAFYMNNFWQYDGSEQEEFEE